MHDDTVRPIHAPTKPEGPPLVGPLGHQPPEQTNEAGTVREDTDLPSRRSISLFNLASAFVKATCGECSFGRFLRRPFPRDEHTWIRECNLPLSRVRA
jgi:hypothetical protein